MNPYQHLTDILAFIYNAYAKGLHRLPEDVLFWLNENHDGSLTIDLFSKAADNKPVCNGLISVQVKLNEGTTLRGIARQLTFTASQKAFVTIEFAESWVVSIQQFGISVLPESVIENIIQWIGTGMKQPDGKQVHPFPIDGKNLMEDPFDDDLFGELCYARGHGTGGLRHLIGPLEIKEEDVYAIIDVQWKHGANFVQITFLAENCLGFTTARELVFKHYKQIFSSWCNEDTPYLVVTFHEDGDTLTVQFFTKDE